MLESIIGLKCKFFFFFENIKENVSNRGFHPDHGFEMFFQCNDLYQLKVIFF